MAPAYWIACGLVLLGAELLLPGVFLLWVGLAMLGAGLASLAGFGLAVQVSALALLLGASVWVTQRRREVVVNVNAAGAGLIGRSATVTVAAGAEGRVRVGDSEWSAVAASGDLPPPGARLRVTAVRGIVLVVEAAPADGTAPPGA